LLSDDLRNWSAPQLLVNAPPLGDKAKIACRDGVTYPHVIDPDDPAKDWLPSDPNGNPNPNFDHPGATPDLYFNHFDVNPLVPPATTCTADATAGGSVGRMSVDLRAQRQATLNGAVQNGTKGYDYNSYMSSSCSLGTYDTPDPGEPAGCATSSVLPPGWGSAYGVINTKWSEGDDVWYGSAFTLPSNFFDLQTAKLIQWGGAANTYGALALNGATDELRLVRGRNGTGAEQVPLVTFGGVPTNEWVWLEVHQVLSPTNGNALTEVFMNGRPIGSSTNANMYSDTGTISSALFGVTEATASTPLAVSVGVDRSTILGGQRGARKGPDTGQAPDTPTGLKAFPGQTYASVSANAVSNATGYRFYRRTQSGLWNLIQDYPATGFQDGNLTCDTTYLYRVTAYRQAVESIVSSPITMKTDPC
jgi:hypothetical protein